MKILAAGDIHGDSDVAGKLAEKAEKESVNLVLLCGDIVGEYENKGLIKPFVDRNLKLLIIPGNHDGFATTDFLAKFYGVKNLHGYCAEYEGIGIIGCGGSNVGVERLSEREIFEMLKKGFENIKDSNKKIMVTHIFPEASIMDKLSHKSLVGSSGLRKAVEELQPEILFCCHAHEAEGIEEKIGKTRVICVGKTGKILEI